MITKTPIAFEKIEVDNNQNRTLNLLEGEIDGAKLYHHTIAEGSSLEFAANTGAFHIILLISGNAAFEMNGITYTITKRASFVPGLQQNLTVKALTNTQLFEINWAVTENDKTKLAEYKTKFPLIQIYEDSVQYTDSNKTPKTINRIVLEQCNIPRFAMGSVESYGVDMVKPHPHPTIDQLFLSFPENEMELIINDETMPMDGNVLVHIPLGSSHGVNVLEGQHMHYMWLDFLLDESCIQRLETRHVKTGTMRSF